MKNDQPTNLFKLLIVLLVIIAILLLTLVVMGAMYLTDYKYNSIDTTPNTPQQIDQANTQTNISQEAIIEDKKTESSKINEVTQESSIDLTQTEKLLPLFNKIFVATFYYPDSFSIQSENQLGDFGNGTIWYRVELTDNSTNQNALMRIESNPDGYGPIFADKLYHLNESNGKINIVDIEYLPKSELNDNDTTWVTARLEAKNGITYFWQLIFEKGEKDFEPIFKSLIESTKF